MTDTGKRCEDYGSTQSAVLALIDNDSWAVQFQTLGQYREALLRAVNKLYSMEGVDADKREV